MRKFTTLLALVLVLALGIGATTASAQTATATVVYATALNVRTAPNTSAGVLAVLGSGMTYTVTGRLADNSWWEIQMYPAGLIGWVSGQYVTITNAHVVPVKAAPGATAAGVGTATITAFFLNARAIPNPYSGAILTTLPRGYVLTAIGKTSSTPTWYNVRLADGSTGWINGNYANIANSTLVPVTYTEPGPIGTPIPAPAFGTVYNVYFLNVRSTPNPYIMNVLTVIARNQTYQVLGKNTAGTWYQINVNGIIGWVNGNYLSVTNAHTVPVTF